MAGKLWHHRRKGSRNDSITTPPIIDDHDQLGCMPNILHFLGPHQRHRARKMLTYHRHGVRKGKTPKLDDVTSTNEDNANLNGYTNILEKGKDDATSKIAPATLMRTIIGKRKSKHGHKREVSKFSRTFSIHHHLENNDYALPNELTSDNEELTSDNENTMTEVDSHEKNSKSQHFSEVFEKRTTMKLHEAGSSMDEISKICQNQLDDFIDRLVEKEMPTQEPLHDTQELVSKLENETSREVDRDPIVDQPKEFLDIMESLSTNKELFLKIVRDPMFAKYVQSQQASSSSTAFEKSISFPAPRLYNGDPWTQKLDGRMENNQVFQKEREISQYKRVSAIMGGHVDDGQNMESIITRDDNILKSEVVASNSSELCFEVLKNQRKTTNASSRFKGLRQKIKDIIRENNQENRRISMDGILHKIPSGQKISENMMKEMPSRWQGVRRNYESKRNLVRIESLPPNNNYKLRSMKRSSSIGESLDRYSLLFEKSSNKELKKSPDLSTLKKGNSDQQSKNKSRTLEKTFSLPDLQSYTLRKNINSDTCDYGNSKISRISSFTNRGTTMENYSSIQLESRVNAHSNEQTMESSQVMDFFIEKNIKGTTQGTEEQQLLIDEQEQLQTCKRSKASTPKRSIFSCMHEDTDDIPMVSNSDIGNQEQSLDPLQITSTPGIMLDPLQGEVEELEFSDAPPPSEENIEDDFYDEPSPEKHNDVDIPPIHVNGKDLAEFKYVKNILWKSGFLSQYALGEWYSIDQPMDPLLFEEVECSPHELNVFENNIDTTIYHMLLFDLINEVLLEIYDASSSRIPWISYVDHIRRPLPVGYHVLEEVWAIICQYISSQAELGPTIESIVAHDFMKSGRWMNLQHDTKIVELQLEDLILEDLVDEVLDLFHTCTRP